jgi:hypothetical protein
MDPGMVDPRLIPGGSFDATPIGMNAFDREDLPSRGVAFPAVNETDDPDMSDEEASRAPFAPEDRGFGKA